MAIAVFLVGILVGRSALGVVLFVLLGAVFLLLLLRPMLWFHVTLVSAFLASPTLFPYGLPIGVTVYVYELTLAGSLIFGLLLLRRPKHASTSMPWVIENKQVTTSLKLYWTPMVAVVIFGVLSGLIRGYDKFEVLGDMRTTYDVAGGAAFVVLAARLGFLRKLGQTWLYVMIASALLITLSSATGFPLNGRSLSAQLYRAGGGMLGAQASANRILTPTTAAALATLAFIVAASVRGVRIPYSQSLLRVATIACILISFFSFSRNALLALGASLLTATLVCLISGKFKIVLRASMRVTLIAVGTLATFAAFAFLPLGNSFVGAQISAYSERVVDGLSPSSRADDSSTQDRLQEDRYMAAGIRQHSIVGSGFGFAYKPAMGPANEFAADQGRFYAHNFHLWVLLKTGVLGLGAWTLLNLGLTVRAMMGWDSGLGVALAGTSVAFLAVMAVSPTPLDFPGSLLYGLLVGLLLIVGNRGKSTLPMVRARSSQLARL
ncbi:O-antigen ligase family protein [Quadrisphaera setariae]|uniref:O-antigen ligase family protein n=1 Tax=Quadrisphaera setariae TaxID=2593304 RepID=UPI00164F2331|nr:O-antigen ligase family protein [Quadrisphaera setariae]